MFLVGKGRILVLGGVLEGTLYLEDLQSDLCQLYKLFSQGCQAVLKIIARNLIELFQDGRVFPKALSVAHPMGAEVVQGYRRVGDAVVWIHLYGVDHLTDKGVQLGRGKITLAPRFLSAH